MSAREINNKVFTEKRKKQPLHDYHIKAQDFSRLNAVMEKQKFNPNYMKTTGIAVLELRCMCCGESFIPNDYEKNIEPNYCPKCKNPNWNKNITKNKFGYSDIYTGRLIMSMDHFCNCCGKTFKLSASMLMNNQLPVRCRNPKCKNPNWKIPKKDKKNV